MCQLKDGFDSHPVTGSKDLNRTAKRSLVSKIVIEGLAESLAQPLRVPLGTGARDYLDTWLTGRRQAFDAAIAAGLVR
jgi:hypothetical protein